MNINNKKHSLVLERMTRNAYGKNGKLLKIQTQISRMKKKPISFDHGVVNIGESLKFIGIKTNMLLFSKRDIVHINKHLNDKEIDYVLSRIISNTVLGFDYIDKNNWIMKKNVIVYIDNKLYLVAIAKNKNRDIVVNEIKTIFLKGKKGDFDLDKYLLKVKENSNKIYKNKKSNDFLSSFSIQQRL